MSFNILSYLKGIKEKEYKDKYFIGKINNFESSITEDKVSSILFRGKGLGDVCVYSSEGMIPHCHIRFSENNENDCCICLITPNYFIHQGKDNTLNNKQMKAFISWCNETNTKFSSSNIIINNWIAMCIFWNQNNPNKTQIDFNLINIPKYESNMSSIKENK